jgi:hypothetical protein
MAADSIPLPPACIFCGKIGNGQDFTASGADLCDTCAGAYSAGQSDYAISNLPHD